MNIILIPYRNREEHWKVFKEYLVPVLRKYIKNLKIVLVEQGDNKKFNRGCLLNAGFKEYEKEINYVYHHDVDTMPSEEVVKTLYTKEDYEIARLSVPHEWSLGGIVKFKKEVYIDINGFPNNIWGWGIEDRALFYRALIKKKKLSRVYNEHKYGDNEKFRTLYHKPNMENYTGKKKEISDKWDLKYIYKLNLDERNKLVYEEGLNTVKYNVIKKEILDKDIEKIIVEI
jgi:predicted glycosyltransferase involved in capsule biosynthesis